MREGSQVDVDVGIAETIILYKARLESGVMNLPYPRIEAPMNRADLDFGTRPLGGRLLAYQRVHILKIMAYCATVYMHPKNAPQVT